MLGRKQSFSALSRSAFPHTTAVLPLQAYTQGRSASSTETLMCRVLSAPRLLRHYPTISVALGDAAPAPTMWHITGCPGTTSRLLGLGQHSLSHLTRVRPDSRGPHLPGQLNSLFSPPGALPCPGHGDPLPEPLLELETFLAPKSAAPSSHVLALT